MPLVSIICLCYNHENFVVQSLQSVCDQKYKNIELIVVDNKSSDGSVAKIKKWLLGHPEVIFIENHENYGNTIAFNRAVQHAKGTYIIDFAADDVLLPHMVERLVSAFDHHPEAAMVYGNAQCINENNTLLSTFFPIDAQQKVINKDLININYVRVLQGGNYMCSVSAMIRKSVFEALNGYDEDLFYEDLDFWLRVSRNHSIIFVDEVLVQKRVLPSSQSSFFYKKTAYAKKINHSTYQILKKAVQQHTLKEEHQALLKRVHYDMVLNFRLRNFFLLIKLSALKLKIHWQMPSLKR